MKKGIDNEGFRAFPQRAQLNVVSNMKYGGRKFNNGGPLLTEFNEGGSHEENPLGGIPQGIGANGQMNVVEQGETKFEDYIFSDQLKLDKETAEEFDLPKKYVGKTFAKISELMNKPNSRREDDSIETADKERNLAKLRDVQESFKQAEVEAKLAEIDQLDPTAIPNLMQQGAQQQGAPGGLEGEMMQQQLSPEEQQMLEQQAMMEQQQMMAAQQGMDPAMQGQPMMAYGGPLSKYAFGGYSNSFESGGKLPKEILRARAKSHMSDAEADAYVDSYGKGGSMNAYEMGGMMDQNMMPIQSYRAGGNCYKCGGKMYGYGGNMYTTGGQLMAGIAGGAAGLAESLLPGQLGSMASRGIETLYNKFDKQGPSKAREEQEDDIFKNAKNVTGIVGDVGESIINPASISGNISSIINNTAELVGDNADLNKNQQMLLNATQQGLGIGNSLLGNYAPGLFKNTPISVSEGEYDVSEMLPDDFAYGGKLNSFANGGGLGDDNRYLVRSEPYTTSSGKMAYRDLYKVGTKQISMDRQPGESIMSEEELVNYLKTQGIISKDADIEELEKKSNTQRRQIEEQKILDERQRQSGLEAEKEAQARRIKQQQELADNTLDLTPMLEGTSMDDNYVAPIVSTSSASTPSGMGPSPEAPVGNILNLGEAQIYNPDLEAWDPSTIDEDNLTPEMKDMIIKQSPLSALAGYAPMAYNLYQGLSPVDKVYTTEDFFTPVSPDLVDYGESRKQAAQFGAGLMRDVRNKGVNPLMMQSAYQAGLGNVRKIAEAEADKNVKILQQNKQFNKKLESEAKLKAETLNMKSKTAKQDFMKEFIKGFYDNQKAQDANNIAAMYANAMNPYINFSYEPWNPLKGLFNKNGKI